MRAKKMVHPVAYAEITNCDGANMTPDITETGFSVVGPEALRKAGMSAGDIGMFRQSSSDRGLDKSIRGINHAAGKRINQ